VKGESVDEIIFMSATAIAQAIREKTISSQEVVSAHLRRIEAVNPKLNAVVQLMADQALVEAREADDALTRGVIKGPLHGVPMTIKDSLDTAGVISTAGTQGRASFVPGRDATAVARMRAAGAILMGKTNTPEITLAFGTDNVVYGRTNNPYDLTRTPGGSSGGAAAILAAGGSPLELGSDLAGSIRLPAHFCGIAGIKPTSGRVPRTGHFPPADGVLNAMLHVGPMARYVTDLVLVLPIIEGVDGIDAAIVPLPLSDPMAVNLKGLRIAFHTDNGIMSPTPETAATVQAAATALSDAGMMVREDRPEALSRVGEFASPSRWDGGDGVRRILDKAGTTEFSPFLKWVETTMPMPTAAELAGLLEKLDVFRSEMLSFMENYDVILCPVNANPAIPHGTSRDPDKYPGFSYTRSYNLTGWPGVVVRGGTSPEGLPIGVQVLARPWRDDVALAVAQYLEQALGGWQCPSL
jgi:amidase